jgi:hypothetical protein
LLGKGISHTFLYLPINVINSFSLQENIPSGY